MAADTIKIHYQSMDMAQTALQNFITRASEEWQTLKTAAAPLLSDRSVFSGDSHEAWAFHSTRLESQLNALQSFHTRTIANIANGSQAFSDIDRAGRNQLMPT